MESCIGMDKAGLMILWIVGMGRLTAAHSHSLQTLKRLGVSDGWICRQLLFRLWPVWGGILFIGLFGNPLIPVWGILMALTACSIVCEAGLGHELPGLLVVFLAGLGFGWLLQTGAWWSIGGGVLLGGLAFPVRQPEGLWFRLGMTETRFVKRKRLLFWIKWFVPFLTGVYISVKFP